MFVDTHCHLIFDSLKDDLDTVLQNAKDADVSLMINIATKETEFDANLTLIKPYDHIFQAIGTHPHYTAQDQQISADNLVRRAQAEPKIVAIGETGLDYHYEYSSKDVQQFQFRRHIEAARRANLPVVVHTRDAEEDTLRILRAEMDKAPFKAIIHCFTGSKKFAWAALDLDCYLSFSGITTFKSALEIQQVAKDCPKERILTETDSPYLAPVPYRGKTNQPAYVRNVAQYIAEIRGLKIGQFADIIMENTFAIFPKIAQYKA